MRFSIANEIPISAQDFWDTAHTPEFSSFLAREYGLIQRELEREIHDRRMHRRIRIVVARSLPHFVSRIVAGSFGIEELAYDEIQEKRLDDFEMYWRIESPALKDRIYGSGTLRLTPIDGERCLRTIEGEILVRIFGVGGKLEKIIAQEIRDTSQNLAEVVAKWKGLKRLPRRDTSQRTYSNADT